MTAEKNDDHTRIAELEHERDELLRTIRELTHLQLISRDVEIGLRAELVQARIDADHADARTDHTVLLIKRSPTWRAGRAVTAPLRFGRRVLGRSK